MKLLNDLLPQLLFLAGVLCFLAGTVLQIYRQVKGA